MANMTKADSTTILFGAQYIEHIGCSRMGEAKSCVAVEELEVGGSCRGGIGNQILW